MKNIVSNSATLTYSANTFDRDEPYTLQIIDLNYPDYDISSVETLYYQLIIFGIDILRAKIY